MKMPRILGFFTVCCALLVIERTGAQTPFTSTSPPNSNPFGNTSTGLPPLRPAQAAAPFGQTPGAPAGYVPAATVYAPERVDPDHRLAPRDQLSYRVQEDRDDKALPLIVTDSGELDIPLIGRVKATGKSTAQLSSEIKSMLEREYYYHATVVLGLDSVAPPTSRGRIFVTGAVKNPIAEDLPTTGTLTASQAVIQAGGPTDFANLKNVRVIRKGLKEPIVVNVKAVFAGEPVKDETLEPGDTVKVSETWIHY